MENPIKDNRIVNDKTFAIRLWSFISQTSVNDPMSDEEKDYLLRVASNLVNYQLLTAFDKEEKDYLRRNDKIKGKILVKTEDGEIIRESNIPDIIFSCLKYPDNSDTILEIEGDRLRNGNFAAKDNRVYFLSEEACSDYLEENTPRYTQKDLERILANDGCPF